MEDMLESLAEDIAEYIKQPVPHQRALKLYPAYPHDGMHKKIYSSPMKSQASGIKFVSFIL